MFGIIFSLVLSLYIFFNPEKFSYAMNSGSANMAMILAGTVALLASVYVLANSFNPLIKAEKKLTPRIMTMFKGDVRNFLIIGYVTLFALMSYFLGVVEFKDSSILFLIWLVLFGLAIDAIFFLIKRIYAYTNPYDVVEMFSNKGKQDIRDEKEIDLCSCVEGLTEIAMKSVHHHSSSLSIHIMDELEQLTKIFLSSAKSLSHHEVDADSKKLGIKDKVSYTLFYLFQRIELIFKKALENENDPLCINIMQEMGKIVIYAAKYDMTMAAYPLHYIGKFIKQLIKKERGHVLEMTSCVLEETAKLLLEELDVTYLEIRETYINIVSYLDLIAKELFREDKNINFTVLLLPFENLKQLFTRDNIKFHPDTPAITQNINRVLAEFETLKAIMQTMPKPSVAPPPPTP